MKKRGFGHPLSYVKVLKSKTKKPLILQGFLSSGREIRTLDTTGMNRVLWPTELFRHDDGAYRARTCDPLLVRQMLSQLR